MKRLFSFTKTLKEPCISSSKVPRSVLFTPADKEKVFSKVLDLDHIDCVIFDLEDSVHPNNKHMARDLLMKFLSAESTQDKIYRKKYVFF
jgi:citrate lyase beta subunit